jgi:cardiolipin synthase
MELDRGGRMGDATGGPTAEGGDGPADQPPESLSRIATVPNALSFLRILMIPVYVALLLHHSKRAEEAGLLILGAVVSTDWVDGWIARRTGQVSNLGKLLDPIADRLALAAALVALVIRHAVPLWAAVLVVGRDALILVAGAVLLVRLRIRLDVRWVGKLATLLLMVGIPLIAWGNFGLILHRPARVAGWTLFGSGIVAYYAATILYAGDIRRAVRGARTGANSA